MFAAGRSTRVAGVGRVVEYVAEPINMSTPQMSLCE